MYCSINQKKISIIFFSFLSDAKKKRVDLFFFFFATDIPFPEKSCETWVKFPVSFIPCSFACSSDIICFFFIFFFYTLLPKVGWIEAERKGCHGSRIRIHGREREKKGAVKWCSTINLRSMKSYAWKIFPPRKVGVIKEKKLIFFGDETEIIFKMSLYWRLIRFFLVFLLPNLKQVFFKLYQSVATSDKLSSSFSFMSGSLFYGSAEPEDVLPQKLKLSADRNPWS